MIALFVFVQCVVLRAFCALMNQREFHFLWTWLLSEAYISCLFQKTKARKLKFESYVFDCSPPMVAVAAVSAVSAAVRSGEATPSTGHVSEIAQTLWLSELFSLFSPM